MLFAAVLRGLGHLHPDPLTAFCLIVVASLLRELVVHRSVSRRSSFRFGRAFCTSCQINSHVLFPTRSGEQLALSGDSCVSSFSLCCDNRGGHSVGRLSVLRRGTSHRRVPVLPRSLVLRGISTRTRVKASKQKANREIPSRSKASNQAVARSLNPATG